MAQTEAQKREGFPARFQVMCWNCNWTKHILGECGCQKQMVEAGERL